MIASRSGAPRLPRVIWRREAKRSLKALMSFLQTNTRGDARARRKEIDEAVESLRHSPLRCQAVEVKDGLTFRRLVVRDRLFVYYVYIPPCGMSARGTLSIRSVKHAASQNPFLDVRETIANDQSLGTLSTRDSAEPVVANA
jgi:plasmid stabilization system protein ParE